MKKITQIKYTSLFLEPPLCIIFSLSVASDDACSIKVKKQHVLFRMSESARRALTEFQLMAHLSRRQGGLKTGRPQRSPSTVTL